VNSLVSVPPPLERARRYTLQALEDGWFPGAQILVAHGDRVLWHEALGRASLEPAIAPMELSTLVDVASLTKALVTSTLAAVFVSNGRLTLDAPLADVLPESRETSKASITVHQLLSHAAGFPLYVPYFKEIVPRFQHYRELPFDELRVEIVRRILQQPLVAAPGTTQQYSDFDFILLGELLARSGGRPLDQLFRNHLAEPLGLQATYRRLPLGPQRGGAFAATELCPWRGEVLQGQVHDDHAYLMGGVAGHAGLFATAGDVFAIVSEWRKALRGVSPLISAPVAHAFWSRTMPEDPKQTWTLGWDTPTPGESTSGVHFSGNTVGHLGFTGSSVWSDVDRGFTVILSTNRIHPLRSNLGIKQFRPAFHDLVMEGLLSDVSATH
jgi:CubicO group peptidase (beta-lactamase class C family)